MDREEIGWSRCLTACILSNGLSGFKRLLERSRINDIYSPIVDLSSYLGSSSKHPVPMLEDARHFIRTRPLTIFSTTLLHVACHLDRQEMAELLINKGCSIYDENLVNAGCDVSALDGQNKSPLVFAAANGNLAAVQFLLDAGAPVDSNDDDLLEDRLRTFPLHEVAGLPDSVPIARLLLEAGANINQNTLFAVTPLHRAARRGDIGVVKLFLEHGADVNALDSHGESVLHGVDNFDMAKLLISLDGNLVSVRNHVGSTTLRTLVLGSPDSKMVEELEAVALLLIGAGASLSDTSLSGVTVGFLHKLAEFGCDKAVKAALGIDPTLVRIRTYRGLTPLHHAAPAVPWITPVKVIFGFPGRASVRWIGSRVG
ncbi:hypothetical protein FQN54_001057 [Arachnomyces sp. PD_36]|nr:hypothetical protein FQN54_001057 [Arachnomyces sp. PD_36]